MHCSTLCRAAGRASTVKVRAGPESKQASVNKTVTSSGGDGRDADERIREFLPKLLDEQESAANSGTELNKLAQWAEELNRKAQQAFADLQRSVSFLGGDNSRGAENGASGRIQDTISKLEGVSAAIADSNNRFDAEFPGAAGADADVSADGTEKVKSREAYLNGLADDIESAEARLREEAAAAGGAANGAFAVASAPSSRPGSAAGAAAGAVKVELAVHRETAPGQDVWVVGSGPALGDWDLGKAVALKWTEGHVWRATIEVDPAVVSRIEYKAVLKTAGGSIIWESGDNRTADVAAGSDLVTVAHEF